MLLSYRCARTAPWHLGDHAVCCRCGPMRIRRHNTMADHVADMIDNTGAHVRREAYVKEFCTAASDAYLDVWAFGGVHVDDLLVDVTIRHPMTDRCQPAASQTAGRAAEIGESDKQERYPPQGGRPCFCVLGPCWR